MHDTVASTSVTVYADDLDNPTNLVAAVTAIAHAAGRRIDHRAVDGSKAHDAAAALLAALGLTEA